MGRGFGAQQPLHGGKDDQRQQRRNGMQLQIRLDPIEMRERNASQEPANDQHAENRGAAPLGDQSGQAQDVQGHWAKRDGELSPYPAPPMIAGRLIYYNTTVFLAKTGLMPATERH